MRQIGWNDFETPDTGYQFEVIEDFFITQHACCREKKSLFSKKTGTMKGIRKAVYESFQ